MAPLTVTSIRLKHISRFRDRHGHLRHYLRLPGCKPVPLPGAPGSPEFMAAYQAAIGAAASATEPKREPARGSLDALCASWYGSDAFGALRQSTQRAYRRIAEELRASHGDKPVRLLDATGVKRLLAEKAGAPTAVNHRLRILRLLIAHALALDWLETDPSAGVRRAAYRTDGFHSWTDAEIAQYRTHHPSGSRARLALELLYCAGVRRSDAVRLGRQHLVTIPGADGGRIPALRLRQVKTEVEVTVPVLPELWAELEQVPLGQLVFLMTEERGKRRAFTPGGFYNTFVRWCGEAGLPPGRSPHGLRKGLGRTLAENGASSREVISVLGQTSLASGEVYTRAAEAAKMAANAMARIVKLPAPAKRERRK